MTTTVLTNYGGWLPQHPAIHASFLQKLSGDALERADRSVKHEPAVENFNDAIDKGGMLPLFDEVFKQVDVKSMVKSFEQLLHALDVIIVQAPAYHLKTVGGKEIGEVIGVPIYLVLDLLSNTAAGYDLFRMKAFNCAVKALLNSWGTFLLQPGSNMTLNKTDKGWFGKRGLDALEVGLRGVDGKQYTFDETFQCPKEEADNKGFLTWDSFFTREFKPEMRPILPPPVILPPHIAQNSSTSTATPIYSACESTIFGVKTNVKKHQKFWLKGQPYSLYDMLNRDNDYADMFVGGTVYQAFLGPTDYHRWHSPIAGTIDKIVLVEGTYYAAIPDDGLQEDTEVRKKGDPHGALIRSQPFLTLKATRALIYINSESIGMVCFIAVGMGEVSTCQVTVQKEQAVEAGDELGMFHFGGSSSVIIFPEDVNFYLVDGPDGKPLDVNTHVWVRSLLGFVAKK